jgi:hypothetical protein
MNKIIIFGAGFLVGAAVGTVVTVFAYQNEKKKWIEKAADLPTKEEKEKIVSTDAKELADYYIQQLIDLGVEVSREDIEYDQYDDGHTVETSRTRTSLVNPIEEEEDEDEVEDLEDGPIEPNPDPYEVPDHEFGNREFYDSATLQYYIFDHTMTDDNYEMVDDWQNHVGYIEERLDKEVKDAIYIRNEVEQTDYEILIYNDSYAHAVEGEDELGNMAD